MKIATLKLFSDYVTLWCSWTSGYHYWSVSAELTLITTHDLTLYVRLLPLALGARVAWRGIANDPL